MSKTKTAPATATEDKKGSTNIKAVKHCNAIAAAVASKRRFKSILMLLLFAVAYAIDANQENGYSYAMLYMIAENGKKSGRADGNVYMRNGRIRGMAIPALVQNAYTGAARSLFSNLSSAFKALSQSAQAAWNTAEGFFTSDRFGRQVPVKGKDLFVRLNGNLTDIGATNLTEPPVPAAVDGITSLTVSIADGANTFSLAFTPTPTDGDVRHKVFATNQLSPGITRPSSSAFRLIDIINQAVASPVDINAEYVVKFGAPVAGKKIFVKLVPVNRLTGQAGIGIIASAVVAA